MLIFIPAMSQAAAKPFHACWRLDSEEASKTKLAAKSNRLIFIFSYSVVLPVNITKILISSFIFLTFRLAIDARLHQKQRLRGNQPLNESSQNYCEMWLLRLTRSARKGREKLCSFSKVNWLYELSESRCEWKSLIWSLLRMQNVSSTHLSQRVGGV